MSEPEVAIPSNNSFFYCAVVDTSERLSKSLWILWRLGQSCSSNAPICHTCRQSVWVPALNISQAASWWSRATRCCETCHVGTERSSGLSIPRLRGSECCTRSGLALCLGVPGTHRSWWSSCLSSLIPGQSATGSLPAVASKEKSHSDGPSVLNAFKQDVYWH